MGGNFFWFKRQILPVSQGFLGMSQKFLGNTERFICIKQVLGGMIQMLPWLKKSFPKPRKGSAQPFASGFGWGKG